MKLLTALVLLACTAVAQVGVSESVELKGLKAEAADYRGRQAIQISEIPGGVARFFLNGAAPPSLIVNELFLGEEAGGVAFWVGRGTVAHFADFQVSR